MLSASEREPEPVVDPWVTLTAIALATSQIRVGVFMTPLARRRPWDVARCAGHAEPAFGWPGDIRRRPRLPGGGVLRDRRGSGGPGQGGEAGRGPGHHRPAVVRLSRQLRRAALSPRAADDPAPVVPATLGPDLDRGGMAAAAAAGAGRAGGRHLPEDGESADWRATAARGGSGRSRSPDRASWRCWSGRHCHQRRRCRRHRPGRDDQPIRAGGRDVVG
jgi:hypothetical protein